MDFLTIKIKLKKVSRNTVDISTSEITSKKVGGVARWVFQPSKLHHKMNLEGFFNHQSYTKKSTWKQRGFFYHRDYIEKSTWKQRRFFDQRNYPQKSSWKQGGFLDHRKYIEKSTWKQRGFFDHQNYIEKSTRKRRGFSISKITSKKYVEMTWKFIEIWSSTHQCNIDIESTWIRRGVLDGLP